VGFGTVFVTEVEGCMDQPGSVDSDCDAVLNTVDNCTNVANADQIDTNSDGIGNICDPDISSEIPPVPANDCSVQFSDLATLKSVFLTNPGSPNWNPDADFDGDDIVAFGDVAIMKAFFLAMPGPAAAPNAASGCVAPVGYAADVQPILLPKCGACHGGNGVGGHDIAIEYNDAFLDADACPGLNIAECALVRIKNGSMPQGAGCTGDPVLDAGNANCLTQAEQDTVEAWIDGGLLP
ncbi:MAG: hypothetical protein OEQ74_09390, partial [Gammaproteobacteria bacterium]|nr:hypothetical protein [Gammaproteobacteria bacterium]